MTIYYTCNLERAKDALSEAKEDYKDLINAMVIRKELKAWEAFLTSIDIVRTALADFSKTNKLHNSWYSKHGAIIKSDELLIYVRNARNDKQHKSTKVPSTNPVALSAKNKSGKPLNIKAIEITHEGDTLTYNIISNGKIDVADLDAEITRCRAIAEPIVNLGKLYRVPLSHLGEKLDYKELNFLADKTLNYYNCLFETAKTSSQMVSS